MHQVATSRNLDAPDTSTLVESRKPWIWPLPRLDGVNPSLVSLPGPPRPEGVVAIGYQDRTSSPCLVPVFAAHDGIITDATRTDHGATIWLDHPGNWSTLYDELEHVLVQPTDRYRRRRRVRVRAGDVLGHARRSSLRIRFALSQRTARGPIAIDPTELMHSWSFLPWFADSTPNALLRPQHEERLWS